LNAFRPSYGQQRPDLNDHLFLHLSSVVPEEDLPEITVAPDPQPKKVSLACKECKIGSQLCG